MTTAEKVKQVSEFLSATPQPTVLAACKAAGLSPRTFYYQMKKALSPDRQECPSSPPASSEEDFSGSSVPGANGSESPRS